MTAAIEDFLALLRPPWLVTDNGNGVYTLERKHKIDLTLTVATCPTTGRLLVRLQAPEDIDDEDYALDMEEHPARAVAILETAIREVGTSRAASRDL